VPFLRTCIFREVRWTLPDSGGGKVITLAPVVTLPGPSTTPGRRSAAELEAVALSANRALDGASAEKVVEWAAGEFGERFAVTSSFADAVLAHVVSRVIPGVEVIFLDTGLHFPETLRVRDQVARTLPLRVLNVSPARTIGQQDGEHGPRLFARDPDSCCAMRKVEPLRRALEPYDAWAAGLRRDEGPTRANTQLVAYDSSRAKVKLSPLAYWTQSDVDAYIERYNVPVNALIRDGYGSVGCWPCTRRTAPGEDPRSGRWAMFDKTECGLHAA
jgi:phosphoadenosine phosphosulfate reductase